MRVFFTHLLLFLTACGFAQTIENVRAIFDNGKVTVTYQINGDNPKQKYKINLHSSHNDFSSPLKSVTGDVGTDITGGLKSITWDPIADLATYTGQLTFKVKGEIIPLAFFFITPSVNGSMRRGKGNIIKWEGGTPGQTVKLEIYEGSTRVADLADIKNTGQYTWALPKKLKTGKNYTLRLADGTQTATSKAFAVKAKIPLLLKITPFVIGAAIIFWPDPPPPPSDKLAGAPNPS